MSNRSPKLYRSTVNELFRLIPPQLTIMKQSNSWFNINTSSTLLKVCQSTLLSIIDALPACFVDQLEVPFQVVGQRVWHCGVSIMDSWLDVEMECSPAGLRCVFFTIKLYKASTRTERKMQIESVVRKNMSQVLHVRQGLAAYRGAVFVPHVSSGGRGRQHPARVLQL